MDELATYFDTMLRPNAVRSSTGSRRDLYSLSVEIHSPQHKSLYLPNEIWLEIIDLVDSIADKKSVRYTSRQLRDLTTEALFNTAYISPNNKDLEVFTLIAKTPSISRCIKTIKYDTLLFEHKMSKECYLEELVSPVNYGQTLFFLHRNKDIRLPENPDPVLNQLLQSVQVHKDRNDGGYAQPFTLDDGKLLDNPIVNQGYEHYTRCAEQQQYYLTNGKFETANGDAMKSLHNAHTIIFEDAWAESRPDIRRYKHRTYNDTSRSQHYYDHGSPLARSWHPLWLRPARRSNYVLKSAICGMSASGIYVKDIYIAGTRDMIRMLPFDREIASSILSSASQAFRFVQRLIFEDTSPLSNREFPALGDIPILIKAMPKLRILEIKKRLTPLLFTSMSWDPLPKICSLEKVYLEGISLGAFQLTTLLEMQPALRSLRLHRVHLTDNSWTYTLDQIRARSRLTDVHLGDKIWEKDSTDIFDITYQNGNYLTKWTVILQDAITAYILHGGVNPLRLQESPDQKLPWFNDTDQNLSVWDHGHAVEHPRHNHYVWAPGRSRRDSSHQQKEYEVDSPARRRAFERCCSTVHEPDISAIRTGSTKESGRPLLIRRLRLTRQYE